MGYHTPQTTAPRESLARKKKKLQKFSFHDQRWPRGVSEWCILGGACVLHQQVPWSLIGASLDRIIHLPTQSDPGVLEMKYIQVSQEKPFKTCSQAVNPYITTTRIINSYTNYVIRCFLPQTNGATLWHMAQTRSSLYAARK